MLKKILIKSYLESVSKCRESILKLVEPDKKALLLDCGCDDGKFTREIAKRINTKSVYGIELSKSIQIALKNGVIAKPQNLNSKFKFKSNTFDVITANQVIEHLSNTDGFVKEILRILKPGGYAVISTNNLSSWHNIVALFIGKQPYPCDISNHTHIGKISKMWSDTDAGTWSHLRVFTMHALVEMFKYYGFKIENIQGVGYYPLFGSLSKIASYIDKSHSVYVTIKVRKP